MWAHWDRSEAKWSVFSWNLSWIEALHWVNVRSVLSSRGSDSGTFLLSRGVNVDIGTERFRNKGLSIESMSCPVRFWILGCRKVDLVLVPPIISNSTPFLIEGCTSSWIVTSGVYVSNPLSVIIGLDWFRGKVGPGPSFRMSWSNCMMVSWEYRRRVWSSSCSRIYSILEASKRSSIDCIIPRSSLGSAKSRVLCRLRLRVDCRLFQ